MQKCQLSLKENGILTQVVLMIFLLSLMLFQVIRIAIFMKSPIIKTSKSHGTLFKGDIENKYLVPLIKDYTKRGIRELKLMVLMLIV